MNRDISKLIKQGPKVTPPMPDDEFTRQAYLEDIARMRDFTPEENKRMWAKGIEPKWKN